MAVLAVAATVAPGSLNGPVLSVEGPVRPRAFGGALALANRLALDRIISRTLAYGLLTVLLGLGYAAVVLGLGRLWRRPPPLDRPGGSAAQ
jgi:hypothetical protein